MGEQKKRPGRRRKPNNGLAINVLMLIVIALIVFEGKTLLHLFSKESYAQRVKTEVDEVLSQAKKQEHSTETQKQTEVKSTSPATESTPSTEAPKQATVDSAYSNIVVPEASTPVDDSYFKDAVFIGDSRMEGFRNQSGITEGTFLTAVGMELESIYETAYIATAEGNITVFDALKKQPFKKVYMMVGTNELGTYDFAELKTIYEKVLADIQAIQTEAVIYLYSVIYVDDNLTEFDYVNNENVDKVNQIILETCKDKGYHYIDLNEVLSNGQKSLIEGASSDGVHLEAEYLEKWLDYTKNHYIPESGSPETQTPASNASESSETTQSESQNTI